TTSSTASSSASASGNDSPNDAEVDCNSEVQPRCGQVASRRTRESSRDQRPTPAGARLTGRLGFHSRRPSKPPSRNVEHDRGESWGSAVGAALKRKWRVASELCSAWVSRPRRSADRRKCWQRVELGIHGLNKWTVKCLEMSRKRAVQAARNGPSPPPTPAGGPVAQPEISTADRLGSRERAGGGRTLCGTNISFYKILSHQYWTGVRFRLVEVSESSQTAACARRDRKQAFLAVTSSASLRVTQPSRLISHLHASYCCRLVIEAMRGRKRSTRRFAEPLSLRKTLRTFSPISQFPQTRSPAMNFICVMDEKRKILARKTVACTQTDEILEFFRQFRPFKVVVEATASYVWFVELVEPLAEKVVLANPKKLRVIAESTKKTDNLDAQVLTEFLVLDMIPESYQPTPRQRQHRALVRHRQYLQGRITSVRSKIRHILSNYNADRKDLFSSNCGLAYLKEVRLNDVDRFVIKQLWAEWQDHLAQRLAVSKKLKAFVAKAPQREAEAREILKTAPQVGSVTAEVVLSELGDISRFRNAKAVCA